MVEVVQIQLVQREGGARVGRGGEGRRPRGNRPELEAVQQVGSNYQAGSAATDVTVSNKNIFQLSDSDILRAALLPIGYESHAAEPTSEVLSYLKIKHTCISH